MRLICFLISLLVSTSCSFAQSASGPDYVLVIDGTEHILALDQLKAVTLRSGAEVSVKLSRREYGRFTAGNLSFEYSGQYTVASTPVDDTTKQHVVMTALGTIMLVQHYESEIPADLLTIMYDKMVEDEKAKGIAIEKSDLSRNIANGQTLKGVRAHYKADDDDVTIDITLTPSGKGGYLVMTMHDDYTSPEEKPMVERFWENLTLNP
jgi:hypothetical protein